MNFEADYLVANAKLRNMKSLVDDLHEMLVEVHEVKDRLLGFLGPMNPRDYPKEVTVDSIIKGFNSVIAMKEAELHALKDRIQAEEGNLDTIKDLKEDVAFWQKESKYWETKVTDESGDSELQKLQETLKSVQTDRDFWRKKSELHAPNRGVLISVLRQFYPASLDAGMELLWDINPNVTKIMAVSVLRDLYDFSLKETKKKWETFLAEKETGN